MKRLSLFVLSLVLLTTLMGCGGKEESTLLGTAEAYVDALIEGDLESLEKLTGPASDPADYILQEYGPEFSGLDSSDFQFEVEEEDVVKIIHEKDGERLRYWLRIEKIGEKYLVTNM